MSGLLRRRYELSLKRAEAAVSGEGAHEKVSPTGEEPLDVDLVRKATSAERQRLLALREDGTIGDAAFQRVEQELDVEELDLEQLFPGASSSGTSNAP